MQKLNYDGLTQMKRQILKKDFLKVEISGDK